MLRSLAIRNLAIIDAVELEFDAGFSVLSGETGAGKSILIDALGLVLGDRADAALVRAGEAQADISAAFSLGAAPLARAWLKDNALEDADDPSQCLLRRVIGADGRSRAFINGTATPLASLRELGEQLVEIHGQNEHQKLLHGEAQRELLDDFGQPGDLLEAVAACARQHAAAQAQIEQLRSAGRDPAQLDYLRHQVRELEALQLRPGELEELFAEHKRLANAGKLIDQGGQAEETLYAGENSLYAQLAAARALLGDLAQLDASFGDADKLVGDAQVQVSEAADAVRRALDHLDLDPERLAEAERRMSAVHELARKHRVRPEELPARLDELGLQITGAEGAEEKLRQLEAAQAAALDAYRKAAPRLSAARRKAARELSAAVVAEIRELGMGKAEFQVVVETAAAERPSALGDDSVRFDFSANPGQPPRPLSKVASGGELSRISLAIQLVATRSRSAATLIFDEIDAGIGGGTAETVGLKLRQLARRRQALCVTHLPQVAAQGQHHYAIHKEVRAGKTLTRVQRLDAQRRVGELARMLGGREITASTEAHAEEMLARARRAG